MNKAFKVELSFPHETSRKLTQYANLCGFKTLSEAVRHLLDEGIKAKEAENRKNFNPKDNLHAGS